MSQYSIGYVRGYSGKTREEVDDDIKMGKLKVNQNGFVSEASYKAYMKQVPESVKERAKKKIELSEKQAEAKLEKHYKEMRELRKGTIFETLLK